jgi:hypothetical protein
MPLSFIPEWLIRTLHYRSLSHLSPPPSSAANPGVGLFEGTPIVNTTFLEHVRKGKCDYIRGDTLRLTSKGVLVNERQRGTKPGDDRGPGKKEIEADVVVIATGYKKPSLDFFKTPIPSESESESESGKVKAKVNGTKKEEGDTEEKRLFPERYERPDLYLQTFSTEDWSVLLTNCAYQNAIGRSFFLDFFRFFVSLLRQATI